MARLIAFILCIAFLAAAGGAGRGGMVVAGLAAPGFGGDPARGGVQMFIGPRR